MLILDFQFVNSLLQRLFLVSQKVYFLLVGLALSFQDLVFLSFDLQLFLHHQWILTKLLQVFTKLFHIYSLTCILCFWIWSEPILGKHQGQGFFILDTIFIKHDLLSEEHILLLQFCIFKYYCIFLVGSVLNHISFHPFNAFAFLNFNQNYLVECLVEIHLMELELLQRFST